MASRSALSDTLLTSFLVSLLLLAPRQLLSDERFHVPPGERQLFVDQAGTQQMDHLIRTMHQPKKWGH
ncbi:MAG: hypothetical protein VX346_15915 [Planctomycetota bacterium]|nr:hypothetical protein [Planctomycetota bacterium]